MTLSLADRTGDRIESLYTGLLQVGADGQVSSQGRDFEDAHMNTVLHTQVSRSRLDAAALSGVIGHYRIGSGGFGPGRPLGPDGKQSSAGFTLGKTAAQEATDAGLVLLEELLGDAGVGRLIEVDGGTASALKQDPDVDAILRHRDGDAVWYLLSLCCGGRRRTRLLWTAGREGTKT